jgi:hypothetical protein
VKDALNLTLATAVRAVLEPSPWEFGWEALVSSIGTLALAGATVFPR